MDTRERRQLRKLAKEMSDTSDTQQYVLARGCLELLDYLDMLLKREESVQEDAAPQIDLEPVTCWCRGEQLWQQR